MSKKDKDKDKEKRKKGEAGKPPRSAWMADLRPSRRPPPSRPPAPPAGEEATAPRGMDEHDEEAVPPTRRSSPLPQNYGKAVEVGLETRIPPLRPLSLDGRGLDDFSETDIAPIGPTEYAGPHTLSPESQVAATEVMRVPGATSVEHLEQQIRDLQARLDDMISRSPAVAPHAVVPPPPPPVARREEEPVSAVTRSVPPPARATAHELLPTDFYGRQWGRAGRRKRAEEVDEFGLDPKYEARFAPFFDFLYKHYFRVEAEGIAHIPDEGRCLLVCNHSGGPLPYDGIMLRTTVRREHRALRELRWLAEDFVYYLPFVGTAMSRLGAVRACQENAERLLGNGSLVAVFPEGAKGIGKLYKERYRLQRFGRGGFIRLCLRTRTPIVPCAIVGAEEANPMLYRVEYMAKALGIPYLPITPTFPALGPLGLLPAPTKWKVTFGEPMAFDEYGPEDADDEVLVGRLAERVRVTIQAMLDRTLAGRRSVWFG